MQLEKSLEIYGLSSKEAKVYLACLSIGMASTLDIAKETKLPRSTIYSVLEALMNMGLVMQIEQEKTAKFSPADPQKIIDKAKEKQSVIESVAPQLKQLFSTAHYRPKIKYYEGYEQIKELHWDILKNKNLKTYDVISSTHHFLKFDFAKAFITQRAKQNIKTRLIAKDSPEIRRYKQGEDRYGLKIKIVPEKLFRNLSSFVYLLPDRVIFLGANDMVAVSIESKEIREPIQVMFDILWNSSLEIKF